MSATFTFSYEDLMFGEDEEEERPGMKKKKQVSTPVPNMLQLHICFKLILGMFYYRCVSDLCRNLN